MASYKLSSLDFDWFRFGSLGSDELSGSMPGLTLFLD